MKTANNGNAILIKIKDHSLQAYLQRYPFATGPDMDKNNESLDIIRKSIRIRRTNRTEDIVLESIIDTELQTEEDQRASALFQIIGVNSVQYKYLLNDFGWRVNKIPRDATEVLSLGCGDGHELIFIHAVLPNAKITAIDYINKIDDRLSEMLNLEFIEGDFNKVAEGLERSYDLIFSNHFLEHSYDPDNLIKMLFRLLKPKGVLIAGLPLDGSLDNVFSKEIQKIVENPDQLHAVDLNYFDPGHPWKTNAADLKGTFLNNGFQAVTIYQRAQHFCRYISGSKKIYDYKLKRAKYLNKIFFSPAHSLVKLIFPGDSPYLVRKLLFAIESRIWFGSNILKNNFSPDVVVIADRE